jgi:hypothetical protein
VKYLTLPQKNYTRGKGGEVSGRLIRNHGCPRAARFPAMALPRARHVTRHEIPHGRHVSRRIAVLSCAYGCAFRGRLRPSCLLRPAAGLRPSPSPADATFRAARASPNSSGEPAGQTFTGTGMPGNFTLTEPKVLRRRNQRDEDAWPASPPDSGGIESCPRRNFRISITAIAHESFYLLAIGDRSPVCP